MKSMRKSLPMLLTCRKTEQASRLSNTQDEKYWGRKTEGESVRKDTFAFMFGCEGLYSVTDWSASMHHIQRGYKTPNKATLLNHLTLHSNINVQTKSQHVYLQLPSLSIYLFCYCSLYNHTVLLLSCFAWVTLLDGYNKQNILLLWHASWFDYTAGHLHVWLDHVMYIKIFIPFWYFMAFEHELAATLKSFLWNDWDCLNIWNRYILSV